LTDVNQKVNRRVKYQLSWMTYYRPISTKKITINQLETNCQKMASCLSCWAI